MRCWLGFVIAVCAAPAFAEAVPEAFAGTWRVVEAIPARIDADAPVPPEMRLIGSTLRFDAGRVSARAPLGCGEATYAVTTMPSRGLFQGAFGEDAAVADAHARALGLSTRAAPTLDVTCDGGLFPYHLTEAAHGARPRLLVMFNRVIYAMTRADQERAD